MTTHSPDGPTAPTGPCSPTGPSNEHREARLEELDDVLRKLNRVGSDGMTSQEWAFLREMSVELRTG